MFGYKTQYLYVLVVQMDLTSFIEKNGCECLNEADNHTLPQLLSKAGALESDCDEQVIAAVGAKFVSAVVCILHCQRPD